MGTGDTLGVGPTQPIEGRRVAGRRPISLSFVHIWVLFEDNPMSLTTCGLKKTMGWGFGPGHGPEV